MRQFDAADRNPRFGERDDDPSRANGKLKVRSATAAPLRGPVGRRSGGATLPVPEDCGASLP
jgi:hypothetical protein